MDSLNPLIIPLSQAADAEEIWIGGKAFKLAKLAQAGFQIPDGFCVTIFAYRQFVQFHTLDKKITFELGRKSFEAMRREEIWDAALRIRSAFQSKEIPDEIAGPILDLVNQYGVEKKWVVRSSAPKEDAANASFAGLHESIVGVQGQSALLDAIRIVWASLWSDAALLYQQELALDPLHSTMAVVVQELIEETPSGVAFGSDPRDPQAEQCIIEAVPGLCKDLVDGSLDPDRWLLHTSTGQMIEMRPGKRADTTSQSPLLSALDLKRIYHMLQDVEALFGWSPDTEWTGINDHFTLLQARPITTVASQPEDEKAYYLSLRPGEKRLQTLAKRVADELIPALEAEGEAFASEDLSHLNSQQLADAISSRQRSLEKWKVIYRDDFIPFAHGVRQLATYYNDAVHPEDPYEFVGLLKGQSMISTQRNQEMTELAQYIQSQAGLEASLQALITEANEPPPSLAEWENKFDQNPIGLEFLGKLQFWLDQYMDISYGETRIKTQPVQILKTLLEMAKGMEFAEAEGQPQIIISHLEKKLFDAVGAKRHEQAKQVLHIGRLSWRLRDDDNLLLGRIESQFLRALNLSADRLRSENRLDSEAYIDQQAAGEIIEALQNPDRDRLRLPERELHQEAHHEPISHTKSRQLIGQPAAPGLISGKARIISSPADLGKFKVGEILVCDAIQPNMTHLVPLAGAIIERRGGMLIHGAIIAREMGIPCVNGIPNAADLIQPGDLVTVDGHVGIATIGEPEFDLELAN